MLSKASFLRCVRRDSVD